MNVLMISGDKSILVEGSGAYARLQLQRAAVDQLDVFVWPQIHAWNQVMKAARKNKYDVITAQDPFWRGLLAWLVARRIGAAVNIQVHTDLDACSFIRRLLARAVLRRADSIRVVSEKIKRQVERIGVCAPIRTSPIFIDLERFRALSHRPHTQKTILWLGRFEREKGPPQAIAVLRGVREAGVDARLIMLGAGSMEKELRKTAVGLPAEFPGWRDPAPYLEVADVAVSTSLHESWGASIIESLAAGVPVVAPDVGIAREAGALVVEKEKLAEAVIDVLKQDKRGELKLTLIEDPQAWAKQWRDTLV